MRIISNFHDYYDGVKMFGHDSGSSTYVRKTICHPIDWLGYKTYMNRGFVLESGVLGFCGELFPFVHYDYYTKKDGAKRGITYSVDEYNNIVKEIDKQYSTKYIGSNIFGNIFNKKNSSELWFSCDFQSLMDNNYILKRKFNVDGKIPNKKELFFKYKVPTFVIEFRKGHHDIDPNDDTSFVFVENPKLLDYSFQKMVDSYQAFQKIEQFINNELVNPDNPYIEPVSDKIKAESHGFNQWSFRKEPSK